MEYKRRLLRQFLIAFSWVFLFLLINATVVYQRIYSLIDTANWVSHTHETKAQAYLIEKYLVDMETGLRGYLITGTEEFLEPYNVGKKQYETRMLFLKELVSDNPAQIRTLEKIESVAEQWQKEVVEPEMEAREKYGTEDSMQAVINLVQSKIGKDKMDLLRQYINDFVEVEQQLLVERTSESQSTASQTIFIVFIGSILAIVFSVVAIFFITKGIMGKFGGEPDVIANITEQIAKGNLEVGLDIDYESESGILASVGSMAEALNENNIEVDRNNWIKTGIGRLNEAVQEDFEIGEVASKVISEISTYLDVELGAIYLVSNGDSPVLSLLGSYAYKKRKNLSNVFEMGEGLVGQAALEKQQILVKNVPEDYIRVTSGLGERIPKFICVTPLIREDRVKGVVEVGTLNEMTDQQMEYLAQAMPIIAVAVESAEGRTKLTKSLEKSQKLTEELQAQQEALEATNEELKNQTEALQRSEEQLKTQQEELQVTNEELEEKTRFLEDQKDEIGQKNKELEAAQSNLQVKARELEITSKYKSEFLANMSHELRTPLNSILILSQQLARNKNKRLDEKQVETAEIVHSSGNDLLNLINEILDLSKIEAGKMTLNIENIPLDEVANSITASFKHFAEEKGLKLEVNISPDMIESLETDRQKLEQIIKNLVSNAIKFTPEGNVTVDFYQPAKDTDLSRSGLDPQKSVAISVNDTGVGIPADKLLQIFEAFQQVDGSTSREYGGTGLGLSISRELAKLLGGEIQLISNEGEGSTFTLYVPDMYKVVVAEVIEADSAVKRRIDSLPEKKKAGIVDKSGSDKFVPAPTIEDDRQMIKAGDRVILVIEDDLNFARTLSEFCHDKEFKCIHAGDGETGLEFASQYPVDAIILDIRLPGIEGWGVLEALKDNPKTRHIPVHIMSIDEESTDAMRKGAIGYVTKPVKEQQLNEAFTKIEHLISKRLKELLVVEDNQVVRNNIVKLIGNGDIKIKSTGLGKRAITEIRKNKYDCVVLDLVLPDISGFEVLKRLEKTSGITIPPIIVYTAKDLTREEEYELQKYTDTIILKGVRSEERLFDETALFLHRVVDNLPVQKRKLISKLHDKEMLFENKKVLLVDDDMRNVFAISQVLEEKGVNIIKAANGKMAVDIMAKEKNVDLVLMDIMMPVMDGYEAMKKIRDQKQFWKLPILALTAKAMKEDRDKCIAAGANDYLPKPVDIDRLLSLMRVWLYK